MRRIQGLRLSKNWTTYMPMLIKLVQATTGSILELGAGIYSTPLLHWMCAENRRYLVTYDDNKKYYEFVLRFKSRNHKIRFTEDWSDLPVDTKWDVVLIDHTDPRRGKDAIRLKDTAKYIILHDSHHPDDFGYNEAYKHFKYKYDWKFCKPWTTVVSNFHDLEFLKELKI